MRKRTGLVALTAAGMVVAGLHGKLRRYAIAESSMLPQLHPGDFVVAQRRRDPLARGEIVIVPHPDIDGFDLIKRVIGLPGETVTLRNGQVHIDNSILAEPWADGPARPDGEWPLDGESVFILGDNRPASAADSRTIGPVQIHVVEWRVVACYWPPRRLGRLSTPVSGR